MKAAVYYNEIDPYCAAWLQNLMDAGHIAPGVIDTRSIEDVRPDELAGYTQCHFFAGIGVWSLALRAAGWPDSRRAWTGSCPCQPFSAAGKGAGFEDERHLWPAWQHLIAQCRPPVIFGEQVASKAVDAWIDLVHADLEGMGYAFGCVPFPSAGVGAPHIRDRTFWVADTDMPVTQQFAWQRAVSDQAARAGTFGELDGRGDSVRLADASVDRSQRWVFGRQDTRREIESGSAGRSGPALRPCQFCGYEFDVELCGIYGCPNCEGEGLDDGGMADTDHGQRDGLAVMRRDERDGKDAGRSQSGGSVAACGEALRPGPTNGFWSAADWLGCTDGKWRPVESKPQPLVDGSAESLGRVRPEVIAKIEEEIDAAPMESQIRRAEVLRALQSSLGAKAQSCWATGRLPHIHEAPFLLAFLRQLQEQGWKIEKGGALPREEVEAECVRVLRGVQEASSSPRQRGLDEQQPGEFADAVHFLSSLLACHAEASWSDAYRAYAPIGFPLEHGAASRVGRLRAYGNAISAPAAEAFIRSVMEATGRIEIAERAA